MARHVEEVPVTLSLSLAAAVAGVSRATFRKRFVQAGLTPLTGFMDEMAGLAKPGQVWRWDLERAIGRELTLGEVQAAECALDQKERKCQRHYRAKQQRKTC